MKHNRKVRNQTLPSDEMFDVIKYYKVIFEYKYSLLFFSLLSAILVFFTLNKMAPVYRSTALLKIQEQKNNIPSLNKLILPESLSSANFLTEYELLKSLVITEETVKRLNLYDNELFDPKRQDGLTNKIKQYFFHEEEKTLSKEKIIYKTALNVRKGQSISPVRNTQLLKITYESKDPELTAEIANTIAKAYIDIHIDSKIQASNITRDKLKSKLIQLENNLKNADLSLQQYREESNLIDINGVATLNSKELLSLTDRYLEASASRNEAEIIYSSIKSLSPDSPLTLLMSVPYILNNPSVQQYDISRASAEKALRELSRSFGKKHPKIIAAESNLLFYERSLRQQIKVLLSTIKTNYKLATEKENRLEKLIAESQENFQLLNRKEFKLNELEREVQINKEFYDAFLTSIKQSNYISELDFPHARIVDYARVAEDPFKPRKALVTVFTFIVSGLLGMGVLCIMTAFNKLIYEIEDIETALGLTVFGKTPLLGKKVSKYTCFSDDSDRDFVEFMLSIRTSIVLNMEKNCKVLLITSSVPAEGKSLVSSNLAASLSKIEKTLLIDMDLHRASLTKALVGNKDIISFSDIIFKNGDIKNAIIPFSSSFHFIGCNLNEKNPLKSIPAEKVEMLLSYFSDQYDRVIIDSPPVHVLSDSMILAKASHSVLYVVKSGSTNINVAKSGIKKLANINIPVSGVILNAVDRKKEKNRGVYDAYYEY